MLYFMYDGMEDYERSLDSYASFSVG